MEWDDYYQMMNKKKGRQVKISDALSTYKRETEEFYTQFKKAENKGILNNPDVWESGQ